MQGNPYKYTGPLHPIHDQLVCVPRKNELEQVIAEILRGDYWTILGPRQIGKTTFLNQLILELTAFSCIYFDMESCPNNDELFYKLLEDTIAENVISDGFKIQNDDRKDFGYEINFYNFLISIEDKGNKKIVLLFDEIERVPVVKPFLKLWRKIFNERNYHPALNKYAVVIAGSVDLIELTIGKTSPFNISKKLYLGELSMPEVEASIDHTMKGLGINLETEAKNEIIYLTSGHPQLMQHLCYLLVEQALNNDNKINKSDVENAIEIFYVESDNLSTLANEIRSEKTLLELIEKIIRGDQVHYLPFKKYSIAGTGPIVQQERYCALRNKIYKEFLIKVLSYPIDDNSGETSPSEESNDHTSTFNTIINLDEAMYGFLLLEDEKKFLINMFEQIDNLDIKVQKNDYIIELNVLDRRHKLTYCYLAYKNYKALNKVFSDWKKIPKTWEYRLSDNPENNRAQKLEWDVFVKVLGKEPIIGDIRVWIYKIRNRSNLNKIGAEDIIDAGDGGRGIGYLLKGKVAFQKKS